MGAVHFGAPEDLALFLRDRLRLATFVETGTFGGGTASWAARHFTTVHSIEASAKYWRAAQNRYAALGNVTFHLGHSPTQLASLMPRLERPMFWLDAHWCGSDTAGVSGECPLLDEVAAIARARLPEPVILIDDARLFLAPPPAPHDWTQWPDLAAVVAALQRCGDLSIAVVEDVIVAVPVAVRHDLVEFWRARPTLSAVPPRPRLLLRGFLKKYRRSSR